MIQPHCEHLETRRLFAIDLLCMSATVVSYDQQSGVLKYSASITNTGATPIPVTCQNRVVLTKDTEVNNADDVTIDLIPNTTVPSLGTLTTYTATINVSSVAGGTYNLFVALDADNAVTEPDNLNNYKFSTTKITIPETYSIVVDGTSGKDIIRASQGSESIMVTMNGETIWDLKTERVTSIILRGGAGNDIIDATLMQKPVIAEGGDGKDQLNGGEGADTLSGNAGPDILSGNGGNDRLNGNGGNDQLFGQSGADRLYGYAGNDLIDGGSSNDRLDGAAGNDTLFGQGGNDRFFAKDNTTDQLFGGSGVDTAQRDSFDLLQSISP